MTHEQANDTILNNGVVSAGISVAMGSGPERVPQIFEAAIAGADSLLSSAT